MAARARQLLVCGFAVVGVGHTGLGLVQMARGHQIASSLPEGAVQDMRLLQAQLEERLGAPLQRINMPTDESVEAGADGEALRRVKVLTQVVYGGKGELGVLTSSFTTAEPALPGTPPEVSCRLEMARLESTNEEMVLR